MGILQSKIHLTHCENFNPKARLSVTGYQLGLNLSSFLYKPADIAQYFRLVRLKNDVGLQVA